MLVIRLQRIGKTKRPTYRLVVSEKQKDTQAGSLEILGQYNPVVTPKVVNLKLDRIKYWLSVGAQVSPTLNNLFIEQGIIKGKKQKSVFLSKSRQAKLNAKKEAEAKAKAAAAPAPEAPTPAEAPAA